MCFAFLSKKNNICITKLIFFRKMKSLKVLSLTLLMSVVFAGITFAQRQKSELPQATPEQRDARRIEMMQATLNLTPEQVIKLRELNAKFAQMREQMHDAAPQIIKAQKDAYDAELKTILTPEQYQKYQEQRRQRAEFKHQGDRTKMTKEKREKLQECSKKEMNKETGER